MSNLYFHFPFCKQACHYCNFHFSTAVKSEDLIWKAMIKELQLRSDEVKSSLESIYFGGGSPSLISPDKIYSLLKKIKNEFSVLNTVEITLEVNPDDVTKNYLTELKQAGINRLSLGTQSFFDEDLKLMNRAHNSDQSIEALENVANQFQNFSIDLIYGMPNSNITSWKENIQRALKFNPPHISAYGLTVEKKTVLYDQVKKKKIELISDEEVKEQYDFLVLKMNALGFVNYEFSNFGKPGFFSINNQNYWNGKSYLGIGPSAHSYDGDALRSWNISNNQRYVESISSGELDFEKEKLSSKNLYNEYIMTGLRKIEGLSLSYVKIKFGKSYAEYLEAQAERNLKSRNFYWDGDYLKISQKAKFLTDGLAADLFKI
jgi:oxygen-independent coproporphyrinogen-3 oxidase